MPHTASIFRNKIPFGTNNMLAFDKFYGVMDEKRMSPSYYVLC